MKNTSPRIELEEYAHTFYFDDTPVWPIQFIFDSLQ